MTKEKYTTAKLEFTDIYYSVSYNSYKDLLNNRNAVIISDDTLLNLYPDVFEGINKIIIQQGEANKNLNTINLLIEEFSRLKIDKKSIVIAFGGGLVSDIVGFAASIYMRGIPFGFIPTTLLAQTDAAIGGKNGVNFDNKKNYIGNITQPEFIICDSQLLKTLSDEDFQSGLGEVLKYALISNLGLFELLNDNCQSIKNRDINLDVLNAIIEKCSKFKIEIVQKDPLDKSLRQILNFGHTFGHAIEIIDNIPHGLAVVKGIAIALDISLKLNKTTKSIVDGIKSDMQNLGFNIDYQLTNEHLKLIAVDKKKHGDSISFVFFNDIGQVEMEMMKIDEINKLMKTY